MVCINWMNSGLFFYHEELEANEEKGKNYLWMDASQKTVAATGEVFTKSSY